jgi:phytoene synthase
MQLTNIARDVGEDAAAGRLYLPLDWLAEAGVEPEAFLSDPRPTPAIRSVIARLLSEADALYRRADRGIESLPPGCRPAIRAARAVYADIGREIARAGHDSVTRRAVTSKARKAALLAAATGWAALPRLGRRHGPPALPECGFLVEAAGTGLEEPAVGGLVRVIEIFTELEMRDRARYIDAVSAP